MGYKTKRTIQNMTPWKNLNSKRILVSRFGLKNKRHYPVLVIDIDSVCGFFDEQKTYHIQSSTITMLASLSQNFKLIAVSSEGKT